MNASDGIDVIYNEGGAKFIEAVYEVNEVSFTVRLTELDELFDALGIPEEVEPERRSNPDGGVAATLPGYRVDRWERVKELHHGRAGAEAMKVGVTDKRLAFALFEAVGELGVSVLTNVLGAPVPSEA